MAAGRGRAALEQALQRVWQGPQPSLVARLLQPLSWVYGALAGLHRLAYDRAWLAQQTAPRPVIVVGNLVAGGAGKTPTVIALLPLLQAMGHRPGVISRGHGRQGGGVALVHRTSTAEQVGDEPLLIHLRTGVPVAVGLDRAAAAQALCAANPRITVLVSDDGLQHHRLARDLQVLVFDDRGAGNGLLLPAGPLRQPMPHSVPDRSLVLYSGGRASTALPGFTGRRRMAGLLPLADWWAAAAGAAPVVRVPIDPRASFVALRGRPVLAAAGLARPEPFFAMLEARGLTINRLPLPDHSRFSPLPWPADTADVVLTEKDATKLRPDQVGRARVWVAALDFVTEPGFAEALRDHCAPWTPRPASPAGP